MPCDKLIQIRLLQPNRYFYITEELDISIDRTDGFAMVLPDNDMFNNFDLTIDQSDDIKKVETGED